MFDWNEDEEVRGTTWGTLKEPEDHIVPYPRGSEDDIPLTVDEYHKKQRHEQTSTNLRIIEERKPESENDFPGSKFERDSDFNTNEELSAPRFDMDPWTDLPSLNSAFGKGYMDRNHLHSNFINSGTASHDVDTVTENLVSGLCDTDGVTQNRELSLKESCSLPASGLVQLDTERDIFGNDHGDEENRSFLNCDWANIADFDDLDRIFRNNDSIFGHEMIGNADELLSPPTDAISAVTQPFSMPVDEQSEEERKPLDEDKEMADNTAAISGQIECCSQLMNVNCESHDHTSDKADKEKKLSKSRKKLEKNRTKVSQNLSSWPSNTSNVGSIQQFENSKMKSRLKSPLSIQSAAFRQQTGKGPGYMGFLHNASQNLLPAYSYPTQPFSTAPMFSPAPPERKENHHVPLGHTVYPESPKHAIELQSKSQGMTPQEKIEKLRWRQQMQAMLAIQKQQQQFSQQSTSTEMSVSQTSSQTNRSHGRAITSGKVDGTMKAVTSSELYVPQETDEPHKISLLLDDSLGETIFYQFQDVIEKLDIGIRLCIRDSLFRLARSAMERHDAGDRSSTNKISGDEVAILVSEETNIRGRSTGLPTETGTNPIDRTVAHLLFHSPSEPGTRALKDEIPPLSSNPEDANKLDAKPTL